MGPVDRRIFFSDRKHGFQDGFIKIFPDTTYFPRGGHVNPQHGVCPLQAGKGELRGFDPNIIQVKYGFVRFIIGQVKHDLGGYIDEIGLQDL